MATFKQINFKVDHLDPMGQGVHKHNGQIYFIPKTLPGEDGTATIKKSSKGVNFATLDELISTSPQRIAPFCEHFSLCQGCHFQHCSYQDEINFKVLSLKKHLNNLLYPEIQTCESQMRHSYRNRIQLHYNLKQGKIGFINSFNKSILSIKNCPLATKNVQKLLKELLTNWKELVPKGKSSGHVEISDQIYWNEDYAKGGFSQVNHEINQKLTELVTYYGNLTSPLSLLDLFSGGGNLSHNIKTADKTLVDISSLSLSNYIQLDLFAENGLQEFKKIAGHKNYDCIIIDPPRKGFKELGLWLDEYPCKSFIYVSCNPATLARDLKNLTEYKISALHLLDMFPSTHHYETLAYLERKH